MNALVPLQTSLEAIAGQPGTPSDAAAAGTLANAQQAMVNTRQMAQAFRIDPEGHIETTMQKLLEDPITNAQGLLRALGPAELNAKGKDLCAQMRPLLAKYPFSPNATAQATVADIDAVFKPQGGAAVAVLRCQPAKGADPAGRAVRARLPPAASPSTRRSWRS